MKLNVKKFGELCGVSVRTLHYYDEIGLLKPDEVDEQTGYRFYGDKAFCCMQEILFYRELDFPLRDIADILSSPNYDKQEALRGQKLLLMLKKARLESIIASIERAEKGESIDMKAFDNRELEQAKNEYRTEVVERWGDTDAYAEHRKKTAGYKNEDWEKVGKGMNSIIADFAELNAQGVKPTDAATLDLVKKLQDFITETQYTCTGEILLSLGEMYVVDERFKNNINKHGKGTAEFMSASIVSYCKAISAVQYSMDGYNQYVTDYEYDNENLR